METAPSSRSSIGPCPMTATKLFETDSTDFCATHGYPADFYGWAANAYGHTLAVFATGPDSVGDGHVIAQHAYLTKCFGTVTNQIHALERCGDLAVLDQIALRQGEHEIPIGYVNLTSTESFREDALPDAGNNLFGVMGPC